jgi:integrating conjugative element protein (TIGR03765 family)
VKRLITILCCAVGLVSSTQAELTVLYDSGRSWPIDRYLEPIVSGRAEDPATGKPPEEQVAAVDLEALLPVRSPSLSPGPVMAREFDTPVPLAFFMIGSDARSLDWLATHRDYLQQQGAVGLLVDAGNKEDLEAVARVAQGLPMTPASGEDIARVLGIRHYPVAITAGRLWQ